VACDPHPLPGQPAGHAGVQATPQATPAGHAGVQATPQATRKGWPYYIRPGTAVVYSRATPCGWPVGGCGWPALRLARGWPGLWAGGLQHGPCCALRATGFHYQCWPVVFIHTFLCNRMSFLHKNIDLAHAICFFHAEDRKKVQLKDGRSGEGYTAHSLTAGEAFMTGRLYTCALRRDIFPER